MNLARRSCTDAYRPAVRNGGLLNSGLKWTDATAASTRPHVLRSRRMTALFSAASAATCLSFFAGAVAADEKSINPKIAQITNEVKEDRIRSIIAKLVSFETRNTMSTQDDPVRGIGAARQWIFTEFQSYSPRLEVKFDKYRVKKQGQRIFKDVDLWNVIATLPGKKFPETQIIISAHYDSLNLGARSAGQATGPGTDAAGAPTGERPQLTPADYEKIAGLSAPGACDDGSGTAAVMELARVMSQYEFDKTLVFVAFAGEEQGLVGSSLLAAKSRNENLQIEAVLNNDIIGTDVAGNGRMSNNSVNVYSDEMMDSVNQQLARYVREIGQRYIPGMKVETIFMQDRIGRGGDHTPFQLEGFAAVRISTPNENYANQHRATDLLESMSVPYTTKVAKLNAAVAASLAWAPKAPQVLRIPGTGGARGGSSAGTDVAGSTAGGRAAANTDGGAAGRGGRRPIPMISRGGGYDAVLQWRPASPGDEIKGYAILVRPTTSPYWEQEIYAGNVTQYTLKDVSIDDAKFGVKAIGMDGSESLVTSYTYPPRQKTEIEVVQ